VLANRRFQELCQRLVEFMGRGGLEPPTHGFSVRVPKSVTSCNINDLEKAPESRCTKSSANSGDSPAENTQIDGDLDALIVAWPTLPDRVKQRIIGLVEGATA